VRIELNKEYGIYLAEVAISLHEAAHACALLQIAAQAKAEERNSFPYLLYVELESAEKSLGLTHHRSWTEPLTGEILNQDKLAFHTACGVSMSKIYALPEYAYRTDLQSVIEYCAGCPNSDAIEKKIFEQANHFVVQHNSQILKLAHELQIRRRIDRELAEKIFDGTEKVVMSESFLNAVRRMPFVRAWINDDEGFRFSVVELS
jgi:hypothetical protein